MSRAKFAARRGIKTQLTTTARGTAASRNHARTFNMVPRLYARTDRTPKRKTVASVKLQKNNAETMGHGV